MLLTATSDVISSSYMVLKIFFSCRWGADLSSAALQCSPSVNRYMICRS